jgi:glycogen synthase
VIFPGYVPDEELPRYARLCAPALGGESQDIVLLEAMACGIPVVATATLGYRMVVHDGANGLLATPGESAALAAALGRLLEHEPLRQRLRAAGLHTARAYAWPSIARCVFD